MERASALCKVCRRVPVAGSENRCPECRARSPLDDRQSAARRGYDRAWERTRLLILARDVFCRDPEGRGCVRAATEVDHVLPRRSGGSDDPGNLQGLCSACHKRKTRRGE